MSISVEQALEQLQSMFPRISPDVIGTVLQMNGGHMQHTVSQLLQLDPGDDGAEDEGGDAAAPAGAGGAGGAPAAAASEVLAAAPAPPRPPPSSAASTEGARSAPSRPTSSRSATRPRTDGRRRWRNPLPDDFLRVPGRHRAPVSSTPADIVEQDAILAQMMQNEQFLDEVRRHPEFADYLEAEEEFYHQQYAASLAAGADMEIQRARQNARRRRQERQGPSLSDKVAALKGEMRRKFSAFAMRFASQFGNKGGEEGKRDQRRGLLEGSDDEGQEGDVVVRRRGDVHDTARARGAAAGTASPAPLAVAPLGDELAPARRGKRD